MNIYQLALKKGFTLTPVSTVLRQTLTDVNDGYDRASKIAARRGIASTAASQRLRSLADRLGVLQEKGKEGKELTFEVSAFGREVDW